jgi:hypothetical protein
MRVATIELIRASTTTGGGNFRETTDQGGVMGYALKKETSYTYANYLEWDTEDQYELIDAFHI